MLALLFFSSLLSSAAFASDLQGVAPAQQNLQITVEEQSDFQVRASIDREGANFQIFCARTGLVETEVFTNLLVCTAAPLSFELAIVSTDDDVKMDVRHITAGAANETKILTGLPPDDASLPTLSIALAQVKGSSLDAFARGNTVNTLLNTFMGNTIGGVRIVNMAYSLSNDLKLTVVPTLENGGTATAEVSLVEIPGDAKSAARDPDVIRQEVRQILKIESI